MAPAWLVKMNTTYCYSNNDHSLNSRGKFDIVNTHFGNCAYIRYITPLALIIAFIVSQ